MQLDEIEMLPAPQKIIEVEQLIRADYRISHPDWALWTTIADFMNDAASIPTLTNRTPRDWRNFNRAGTIANEYIEKLRRERAPVE
jgi:hypothetical protein